VIEIEAVAKQDRKSLMLTAEMEEDDIVNMITKDISAFTYSG
jgi:hypothetical protein